ncbi:YfiR family protein [Aliivibrio sifiae]|uniref:DUF4154 domain-containing protein n=1 Tax=Aliivibrio sifiae TaxID=566293 RepID=A0A2S7X639_9GAMM|nr:YfiR family protein [Aliivibrio sifiae]PQJ86834.1 hypothetical protein BTO23_11910 [Aliivibrio sifiae]GLR74048.1 hypothetical protein GCM10007855_09220 [Aliivibrio sifiae]
MLKVKARASSLSPPFYGFCHKVMVCLILLLILPISSFSLQASNQNIQDHELKAVYLFRFVFLTSWGNFAPTNKQFNFCSEASLDVSYTLEALINKKPAQAVFIPYSSVNDIKQHHCHIIYSNSNNPLKIQKFKTAQPHAILVGDGKPFISSGGMIAFIKVNNRIKPLISLENLAPTELSLRSQLLSVSEIASAKEKQ